MLQFSEKRTNSASNLSHSNEKWILSEVVETKNLRNKYRISKKKLTKG